MPTCDGCGASYAESIQVCPYCGRAAPDLSNEKGAAVAEPKKTPYDCPICGDASNVQKVSAALQHSTLAQFLAMPAKPEKPESSVWNPGKYTITIAFVMIGAILYIIFRNDRAGGLYILVLTIALTFFGVRAFKKVVNDRMETENKDARAMEKYKAALRTYHVGKSVWNSLYYCHRHDIVYRPGSDRYAPKEEMWPACVQWGSEIEAPEQK